MTQTDRRVRRTHKSLGDALIALALEKEYDDITIQEITERADIGYRTFFRHYSDKDELLKDVLISVQLEMRKLMDPPAFVYLCDPDAQASDFPGVKILFEHVQKNSDLYRVLLFSKRGLISPLKAVAIQEFDANFSSLIESDIPFDIMVNHMISSMISMLRWWLENDMCYSPEEMGSYAYRLIIQPIRNLILQGSQQAANLTPPI